MPFSANSYDYSDFITSGAECWTVPPPNILPKNAVIDIELQQPGRVECANMCDLDFTTGDLEHADVQSTKVALLEPVTRGSQAHGQLQSSTSPWATL